MQDWKEKDSNDRTTGASDGESEGQIQGQLGGEVGHDSDPVVIGSDTDQRRTWRPRVRFNSSAARRQDEQQQPGTAHYQGLDSDGSGHEYEQETLLGDDKRYSAMEAMQRAHDMAMSVDDETEGPNYAGNGKDHIQPETTATQTDGTVDVEKNIKTEGEVTHTVEAEVLWQAHQQPDGQGWATSRESCPVTDNTNSQPVVSESLGSPDDGYTVTGNLKGGIFYHLLQTYKQPMYSAVSLTPTSRRSQTPEPLTPTATTTATATPTRRKWYDQDNDNRSQETLAQLIGASKQLANPNEQSKEEQQQKKPPEQSERGRLPLRLGHKRNATSESRAQSRVRKWGAAAKEDETRIKRHVAGILQRQRYLIKMCRALMLFGAPTHRLEEYMATTAKVLEMDSQFLYIPGCMIISFDDALTHTTEVKIVRTSQGVNLGKLKDLHHIYKEVLHDVISLDEATTRLDELMAKKDQHPIWLCVLMYGLCSTTVSCFFKARPVDFPIIFVLGTVLGVLQLVVAPLSKTYSTVFEVSSAMLMTFLSRAISSVKGGEYFCFSAITQSSIAMILPGWLVLSSALELQSKAIVPGSIRIVYAVIYSLFLGYGITVGTALYGAMDSNATESTQCVDPMNAYWNFLFVPLYLFFLTFTVQAKWKQMPVMIVIAFIGYIVNFYTSTAFSASAPIAYTFGAFAVGVLANLYSRLRHGVAAAVLLPAVYVQVPGSLAASGAITSGLNTAKFLNDPTRNTAATADQNQHLNAIVFNVAASMIQIAIGITVGLFMSSFVIYPLGKRRSGLWTL